MPKAETRNHRKMLRDLHVQTEVKDAWGWSVHEIGQYTLATNGTAWTAKLTESGRRASIVKVALRARELKIWNLSNPDAWPKGRKNVRKWTPCPTCHVGCCRVVDRSTGRYIVTLPKSCATKEACEKRIMAGYEIVPHIEDNASTSSLQQAPRRRSA